MKSIHRKILHFLLLAPFQMGFDKAANTPPPCQVLLREWCSADMNREVDLLQISGWNL